MSDHQESKFTAIIRSADAFIAKVKAAIAPVVKVGIVISAIYSVYMVIVFIGGKVLGYSVEWLTDYPYSGYVMLVLMAISMITLVLSGGIIEAFRLLAYAFTTAFEWMSLGDDPYDYRDEIPWIEALAKLVLGIIGFMIPLVFAMFIILCVPIGPILVHKLKD